MCYVLKLMIPEKSTAGILKASGHFITSIDAHSQHISRILTTSTGKVFPLLTHIKCYV